MVFCSSKTRAEIEALLAKLRLSLPFVVENGGGIYIPEGFFSFPLGKLPREGACRVIRLGAPYRELVRALREVRAELGVGLRGFSDMTVGEIAQVADLSLPAAALAERRSFDEPFLACGVQEDLAAALEAAFESRGLRLTRGGRFFHVTGSSDKGKAVARLNELFSRESGAVFTVGIGDSANDLPMLAAVDCAVLVRKPEGVHDAEVLSSLRGALLADGIGPEGWARAVFDLVGKAAPSGSDPGEGSPFL